MKKLLATVAILAALPAGSALAADVVTIIPPAPAPVYVPPPAPAPTWTGPYIGVHVGYGWGTEYDNLEEVAGEDLDTFPLRGLLAGIHAGYNFQAGNIVFGIEGDVDYARIGGELDNEFMQGPDVTMAFNSDLQASIRARAGLVIGDSTLLYGTAGIAFGRGTVTVTTFDGTTYTDTDTQWHRGFTFGGGVEHKFTEALSARLEVRHTRFGTEEYVLAPGTGPLFYDGPVSVNFNQTTLTAGVTLHF